MAEGTKVIGGGISAPSNRLTRGRCPRVPNDGTTTDFQDSPYSSVEVSLTAAQIKALRATPITMVPAPGAGKVIDFIGAHLQLIAGGTGFTESGANLGFKYTDGSGVQVNETVEATGFIDQTVNTNTSARKKLDPIVAASAATNQALVLHNIGGSEIATGDGTMKVKVLFAVHAAG